MVIRFRQTSEAHVPDGVANTSTGIIGVKSAMPQLPFLVKFPTISRTLAARQPHISHVVEFYVILCAYFMLSRTTPHYTRISSS